MGPSLLALHGSADDDEQSYPKQGFIEDENDGAVENGTLAFVHVIQSSLAYPGLQVLPKEAVHALKCLLRALDAFHQQEVIAPPTAITYDRGFSKLRSLTNNDGVGSFTAFHHNSLSLDSLLKGSDAPTLLTVALSLFNKPFIAVYTQVLHSVAKSIYSPFIASNKPPPPPAPKPYPTGPHQSGIDTLNALQFYTILKLPPKFSRDGANTATNEPPPRPAPKPYPTGPSQSKLTRPHEAPPRPAPKPYPTWVHQS
ncbi:uncharacterized protein K460DRAFT_404476 [Cucurbitaria berberidis CBS 394.84]|uniref:Uncharacterized protein n=1 Tax=Cucurbitaria berberidis CBS 394.84 TaxID=1168544 RepID=A0A9P4GPX3_9PLEO|nr:uncharacterized protein K460DRAFT_404476 [Cucurbitaria berberidis CBS 394.84]KAF1849241.1 hypothetical protein K460DRAFT_404476 [Cucurbitaria berberidis CBS 394.84]